MGDGKKGGVKREMRALFSSSFLPFFCTCGGFNGRPNCYMTQFEARGMRYETDPPFKFACVYPPAESDLPQFLTLERIRCKCLDSPRKFQCGKSWKVLWRRRFRTLPLFAAVPALKDEVFFLLLLLPAGSTFEDDSTVLETERVFSLSFSTVMSHGLTEKAGRQQTLLFSLSVKSSSPYSRWKAKSFLPKFLFFRK